MKKQKTVLWLIVMFILAAASGPARADQAPAAAVTDPVYRFEPVWEGDSVTHSFIIRNKGTAPLEILRIQTDCGCTAASAADRILPGEEGGITLSLNTQGYGGHTVNKITKVHTNDPKWQVIQLEMTGHIRSFALLDPGHIELTGKAGEPATGKMIITPAAPDLDFEIAQVTVRDHQNIRYELTRHEDSTPAYYELAVENIKPDPGRYLDVITLWVKPSRKITVRVFGNIFP